MIFNHITKFTRRFYQPIVGYWKRNIYYVSDSSKWAFYWIANYLARNIYIQHKKKVHIVWDIRGLRNQIIHFGNRYAYLKDSQFTVVHPSNKIFLTWLHGDPSDPNPQMQYLLTVLPKASNYVEKIVVSCDITAKTLLDLNIPNNKLLKIPLGVDLSVFHQPNIQIRQKTRARFGIKTDFLCIGSFQKDGIGWGEGAEPKMVKGPDIFLEVMANLVKRYNNILVILTGPARGYVKKGLEKLGIPYLHNFLSNYHYLVSYYQVLDLYIISSRCEGGPLPLLESWATGVPLVSTRVGMPADLIRHRENGMIADIEDIQGLTDHTIELIENEALRNKCRQNGMEEVKKYDWPLIAEAYYNKLYSPFLEKK